jgi:hypothetical protein
MWVIDYSQLERIYYALVAGFDVFGNLTHQVSVRRYMDYLRIEGELNFIDFMPSEARVPMLQSWYIGDKSIDSIEHEVVASDHGTLVHFETDDPKREFVERVVNDHILKSTKIEFDEVNYHPAEAQFTMPTSFETDQDILNGFKALTAPGTAFIRHNNMSGINLFYVHVRNYKGKDHMFSIVINRWHDNVNSLFGEEKRLDPAKDTINFIRGSVGSYPNFFFVVEGRDVPDFFDLLANFDGSPAYLEKLHRYGVNRADDSFWETYDWFQDRLEEADPLRAGLYDLNRYYHEAR